MTILHTDRLCLRPVEPGDFVAMRALWVTEYVRRYLFDDRVVAVAEAGELFEASERNFREHGYGIWCIAEGGSQQLIGFVGLLSGEPEPSLVYKLCEQEAGRGLATEAARAVLHHAFGRLGLPRVLADVDEPNQSSVRVLKLLKRLGATPLRREIREGRPLLSFELDAETFASGG